VQRDLRFGSRNVLSIVFGIGDFDRRTRNKRLQQQHSSVTSHRLLAVNNSPNNGPFGGLPFGMKGDWKIRQPSQGYECKATVEYNAQLLKVNFNALRADQSAVSV
jgi:hypothetical protein